MIEFDLSTHTCDAFVLVCMDFRHFNRQTLHNYMLSRGIETYDVVAVPGSGLALLKANSRQLVLDAVNISLELHKTKDIYLIHHKDCGAYGGSGKFNNPDAEREHHETELRKACEILEEKIGETASIHCIYFDTEESESGGNVLKPVEVK